MKKFLRVIEVTGSRDNATLRERYVNISSIVSIVEHETLRELVANSVGLSELDDGIEFSTIQLNVGMHGATLNVVGSPHVINQLVEG